MAMFTRAEFRAAGKVTALGGSAGTLVALVARDGLRMISCGAVLGLASGWAATRLLTFLLYGVSPFDAPAWIIASLLMLATGVAATLVPALRAARCDPVTAMRAD
jgi:putative ABC transport system permease protein